MAAWIVFLIFLSLSAFVGTRAAKVKKENVEDYLLSGRNLSAWSVGLSALSSNFSGFMFVGFIGLTYTQGFSALWVVAGWLVAEVVVWGWFYDKLRKQTSTQGSLTIPSFINSKLSDGPSKILSTVMPCMILIFLGTYAAAQLTAGSKALHVLFGWHHYAGALMGGALVVLYCFSGGIRASVWTDVLQAIIMLVSMCLVAIMAIWEFGGASAFYGELKAIDPQLVSFTSKDAALGSLGFLLGWFGNGMAVMGQPHIIVRPMMLGKTAKMAHARLVYFSCYIFFILTAMISALACRALLSSVKGGFDSELALPMLAQHLMHPGFVGLMLAGIFAATMSTADSQILSCTASVSQDLFPRALSKNYMGTKLVTVGLCIFAVGISIGGSKSVFTMVMFAWSGLGVAFGPILMVILMGKPLRGGTATVMSVGGVLLMLAWKYATPYAPAINEVFPAMLGSFLIYGLSRMAESWGWVSAPAGETAKY